MATARNFMARSKDARPQAAVKDLREIEENRRLRMKFIAGLVLTLVFLAVFIATRSPVAGLFSLGAFGFVFRLLWKAQAVGPQ